MSVKSVGFALVFLAATAVVTTAAGLESASPGPSHCGGQLWRLKTFSDPQRKMVQLTPKPTTIGALGQRPFPRPVPRKRRTPFQRQTWEVVVQVTKFRAEFGGVRLEMFDAGSYANAVIPPPDCLSRATRARAEIAAAWKRFIEECGQPARSWQSLGAVVHIRGVGFWSQRRMLRGSAPNGAELHPVTGFRVVVGC